MADKKLYDNLKNEKNTAASEAVITGEITAEALQYFRTDAIKHFQSEITLPGFRKGMVPEKMVVEKIGESLLEEAGQEAIKKCFAEIMRESKLDTIGVPQIAITKLALGSPLEFKITIATFPEFELSDYKKIGKNVNAKKETNKVTDKELEEAINNIRRMKAEQDFHKDHPHDEPGHTHPETKDADLPPLTDELTTQFGKFENVDDFKAKLKESLEKEKDLKSKEKIRLGIVKEMIEKTEISLPRILVESELDRMMGQMKDDIERMGVKHVDYMKRINKTETDFRKEWEKDAIERVKMELLLGKIAETEKIEPTEEEIKKEVTHLLEHYADTDPIRAAQYFRHVIQNEKVFQFLEEQK